MNSTIDHAIMKVCMWNPAVTRDELIIMLGRSIQDYIRDVQSVENTIVGIDRAIMEISDGFLEDDHDTEEENYSRTSKVIATLEETMNYFEGVLEYIETFN